MTEPLTLQGRWWLPEHEDHQVFGTLTWDASDGGKLQLHDELQPVVWLDNVLADGSVQKYREDRGETQRTYPLIFGRVEHRSYTLLDSFRLNAREYDMDERTERVHFNRFLEGAWFDPDELRVDRLIVDMRHLTGWINHSGLEVRWPQADDAEADVYAVVTAKILPPFTDNRDDISVRITQVLGSTGDRVHHLGATQRWSLRLDKAETEPVDTFLDIASDIQDLVSIAVGRSAQFERVVLQHPELPALSSAGTPFGDARADITYYAQWSNRSALVEPVKTHEMYFTFDHLGGIDGIGRWLTVAAEYRTELGRVMATRYREGMVLEDRIMNVSAALDSFYRHRTGDDNARYVERIRHCVELAGRPFLDLIAQDSADWAKSVKESRHGLAHHRERFRTEGSVGDHILAEQVFWLFATCMLRLAQAPEAVFEAISRHAQIRWLSERAQASGNDKA